MEHRKGYGEDVKDLDNTADWRAMTMMRKMSETMTTMTRLLQFPVAMDLWEERATRETQMAVYAARRESYGCEEATYGWRGGAL